MKQERDAIRGNFARAASAELAFLTDRFEFSGPTCSHPPLSEGGIDHITFGSAARRLVVDLFIDFETYYVDLAIAESPDGCLHSYSVWGQKQLAQAMLLTALIQHLTGEVKLPLPPDLPTLATAERTRRLLQRREMINNRSGDVVRMYAKLLDDFSEPAITQPFTLMSDVQQWYRRAMCASLSSDGRRVILGFE
ncbi:MAG: hypothetical protein KY476_13760 [Planctomycetes bacterium]|nr:hypothetical protein [Planctomycetota bacterium]